MVKKIIFFFSIMLATSPVYAKSKRQRFIFLPELQGLNTSVSPLILDPKALVTATNVIYDHVGSRKKRGGATYLNQTYIGELSGSNTVMGLFDFRKISTAGVETRKLICHSDGKIFKMDSYDGTWDNISSRSLTIDKPSDYAVLRKAETTTDTVIMVNGTELPQTWNQDAVTVSDLTGYPTGISFYPACIETHKFRLWASGVPSYPYRVYFSAANKYDDWNTGSDAGYIDIIDSYGSRIMGLVSYYDYLIVFTENSIHRISGSSYSDFAAVPLIPNLGAVNNSSIVANGNDIFFVSRKGIHSLTTTQNYGDIQETYLSAPIQKDFNSFNFARLKYCCGSVYPQLNYLIWSFSNGGSSTNGVCYLYDYIGKRWSKWTGINASCFAIAQNTSQKEELIAGCYDGFVNRLNQANYNDNGSAYTMTWTTPYINFGDPVLDKAYRELFVFLKPQGLTDLTVSYRIDNQLSDSVTFSQAGTSATLGTFVLGSDTLGGGALVPLSQSLTGHGKTIQLTATHESSGSGSEVYGFALEVVGEEVDYSN